MRTAFVSSIALLLVALPTLSTAGTIRQTTFTGVPGDLYVSTWEEDGITARGTILSFNQPDAVHLDTGYTQYGPWVEFSTGGVFEALSVDIDPGGGAYCAVLDEYENCTSSWDDPYDYIFVTGYLNDLLVAEIDFYLPSELDFQTILLGDEFARLDRLVVRAQGFDRVEPDDPWQCAFGGGCGHFDVDNVVLRDVQPVPEPTGALLFAAGLIVGSAVERRRPGNTTLRTIPETGTATSAREANLPSS